MTVQTDYQREAQEKRDSLAELTKAVAAELDGWEYFEDLRYDHPLPGIRYEPHGADPDTINPDMHFHLNQTWGPKGKIHVHGNWPTDGRRLMTPRDWGADSYKAVTPSINVSASRGPQAIARDIERRFLPEYTRLFNLCMERKLERQQHTMNQNQLTQQLAGIIGAKADLAGQNRNGRDMGCGEISAYRLLGDSYGEIQINGPNSVDFRLRSLDRETALALAMWIRDANDGARRGSIALMTCIRGSACEVLTVRRP